MTTLTTSTDVPGSPARPAEEQEWLDIMKKRMFAMIADHNYKGN